MEWILQDRRRIDAVDSNKLMKEAAIVFLFLLFDQVECNSIPSVNRPEFWNPESGRKRNGKRKDR